jgi:hypothetical protein
VNYLVCFIFCEDFCWVLFLYVYCLVLVLVCNEAVLRDFDLIQHHLRQL